MSTLRDVFPPIMINMVRIGEQTGRLDTVFNELQRNSRARAGDAAPGQDGAALPDHGHISAIVIARWSSSTIFVIPSFARIFANFHAELPLITRGLIGMSDADTQLVAAYPRRRRPRYSRRASLGLRTRGREPGAASRCASRSSGRSC